MSKSKLLANVFYGFSKMPKIIDWMAFSESETACLHTYYKVNKDEIDRMLVDSNWNESDRCNIGINSFDFIRLDNIEELLEELVETKILSSKGTYCLCESNSRLLIYSKEFKSHPKIIVFHNLIENKITYYVGYEKV